MLVECKFHKENELTSACEKFSADGMVFFDNLLDSTDFKTVSDLVDSKLKPGVHTENLVNLHLDHEWMASFVSQPVFTTIASALLDVPNVKIFSSLIINKPPLSLMSVPWHQDAAYDWPLSPHDCASLWYPLDDVCLENGAMEVALGGHLSPALDMVETQSRDSNDALFSSQLQRSIPEELLTGFVKRDVIMKQGQASFHHSMLPHASRPNISHSRRCAIVVRYCRGDAKLNKYSGMLREQYFKDFELFDPVS
jgi:ectoine hydroxylase-related dioxygenase (phytanoyl-CoA dioxygenase family)